MKSSKQSFTKEENKSFNSKYSKKDRIKYNNYLGNNGSNLEIGQNLILGSNKMYSNNVSSNFFGSLKSKSKLFFEE